MKLVDMGYKEKMDMAMPVSTKNEKEKICYPELELYHKVPPELMSKDIEAMVDLHITAKIIRKGIEEREGKKQENMRLEIHQMGMAEKQKDELKEKMSKRKFA